LKKKKRCKSQRERRRAPRESQREGMRETPLWLCIIAMAEEQEVELLPYERKKRRTPTRQQIRERYKRAREKAIDQAKIISQDEDGTIHMRPPPVETSSYYTASPSPIHGTGLFASIDIPRDTLLGYYHGRVLNVSDMLSEMRKGKQMTYWMELGENFVIDGSTLENEMRYMNHADKKSPACNCIADQDTLGRLAIRTRREVKKGEELLFNYGHDPRREWK
jgi:hypothetical protein